MADAKLGWKKVMIGGMITTPGNSENYETGSWRAFRPIRSVEKCTNCLICWIYCPDSSIQVADGKVTGIDYVHCKGCGICAKECPPKFSAITMVEEASFAEEEGA
jgi:pyruvate ferredoxin oxidoreductase delta subunit